MYKQQSYTGDDMANMIRDSFFLTKPQKERLVEKAKKLGIKTSELLRRIIDEYFEKED